jgi:hypothetical protein
MLRWYLGWVHQQALWKARYVLSVRTGERAIIAFLLGGIYLLTVWNVLHGAVERKDFWLKAAATSCPLIPYVIVYFFWFLWLVISKRSELTRVRNLRAFLGLDMSISDVVFDPNGITEVYVVFNVINLGMPSTIKDLSISAFRNGDRIIDLLPPRMTFAPLLSKNHIEPIEEKDPALTALDTGEEKHFIFTFTYPGDAKRSLGRPGTRFLLAGFDMGGRKVSSEYKILP